LCCRPFRSLSVQHEIDACVITTENIDAGRSVAANNLETISGRDRSFTFWQVLKVPLQETAQRWSDVFDTLLRFEETDVSNGQLLWALFYNSRCQLLQGWIASQHIWRLTWNKSACFVSWLLNCQCTILKFNSFPARTKHHCPTAKMPITLLNCNCANRSLHVVASLNLLQF